MPKPEQEAVRNAYDSLAGYYTQAAAVFSIAAREGTKSETLKQHAAQLNERSGILLTTLEVASRTCSKVAAQVDTSTEDETKLDELAEQLDALWDMVEAQHDFWEGAAL